MPTTITEQTILDSLRQIPVIRWGEVLDFLDSLRVGEPAIRNGADLIGSGSIGVWAEREDFGTDREFAREQRRKAEERASNPSYRDQR